MALCAQLAQEKISLSDSFFVITVCKSCTVARKIVGYFGQEV